MYPGEVASLHYLLPANPAPHLAHFHGMEENAIPPFHFSGFFAAPPPASTAPHLPAVFPTHEQAASLSNNSNSDEGDEQQRSLIEERRRRRMISNRESARRSRMRKQRHLDELQWQVTTLRSVNRRLIDELNRTISDRDHMLHENSQLRDEASGLRQRLQNMQVDDVMQDPEAEEEKEDDHEGPCNPARNQRVTASS